MDQILKLSLCGNQLFHDEQQKQGEITFRWELLGFECEITINYLIYVGVYFMTFALDKFPNICRFYTYHPAMVL
jgi:hypothetical protein